MTDISKPVLKWAGGKRQLIDTIDENLPPEYTMIFDSMRGMYPNINPIIEHFQASRKLRNII